MISSISPLRLDQILRSRWVLPEAILDELEQNREFATALRVNVGVQQSFTLRKHTLSVMDCYEKHFAQTTAVNQRTRGLFRLFLALHDIGKPLAIEAGDKRQQHRFTVDLMRRTRDSYPVSDQEFADWIALVNGDPIGSFLKGEISCDDAAEGVRRMAAQSSLLPRHFFKQLMIYYQCDASAYTSRAGLLGILDGLFEWRPAHDEIIFDTTAGLLRFSERIQREMSRLTPELIWKNLV